MSGMGMGGGRRGGRVAGRDIAAQKAANAQAPKIPHLLRRIAVLFAPHKAALSVTVTLVLISSAMSVVPPLLIQRVFDNGLFPKAGHPDYRVTVTWSPSWWPSTSSAAASGCGRPT
jgi:ATP-binding cassette subfamily B protein